MLAVLGVGMTFVIITSGIDLSIGSVLVFASVVSAKVMEAMGGDGPGWRARRVSSPRSSAAWSGASLNGVLVAKAKVPAADRHPRHAVGGARAGPGASPAASTSASVPAALTDFSVYTSLGGIPALPFVALVIVVIGGILLHKTRFGRYTYAIGSNEEAARRVGIKVDRHLVLVYALAGTLAGIGAILRWPSSAPRRSPASR